MKFRGLSVVVLFGFVFTAIPIAQAQQEPGASVRVKRAARPVFNEKDWRGTFFANLFTEGLVGERPAVIAGMTASAGDGKTALAAGTDSGGAGAEGNAGWSTYLTAETLENEIKRIQIELNSSISTPGKFSTEYARVNHLFVMLTTWFAIVKEFDSDVRWKDSAAQVLGTLARASVVSRSGAMDGFNYSQATNLALTDMVRGGNFAGSEPALENFSWPDVSDRTEMMVRLDELLGDVKQSTANEQDFQSNRESLEQQASLVAAIAHVLTRPDMDLADEEGYAQLARGMESAAISLSRAAQNGDYNASQLSANGLAQSCDNCHAEWR